MSGEPDPPRFPGFDPRPWVSFMTRALQGPEQAYHAYRELLGLEGSSREHAVDFMAQMARSYGLDVTPWFEAILRFHPAPTARTAAAAYLAAEGREDTVLEVLESLRPPLVTMTLLTGLLDALATRPATPERVARLIAFAQRFNDDEQYTTPYLGHFTGRDVKRLVRRAVAESLLRRHAPEVVSWPRE